MSTSTLACAKAAIVTKLCNIKPAKVRIACRAADWLGDTDLSAFNIFFERNGGSFVLGLEALTYDERLFILNANGIASPQKFIDEAESRELDGLLANPQNLIMLANVVQKWGWPNTRTELYKQSTELLLSEHSTVHSRIGGGVYSPEELYAAAGALCATRLISDVDGISLADRTLDDDFPSYRGLSSLYDVGKIQAALGRRLFLGDRLSETVDYTHRTLAEYLGASWLAKQVRQGLPLSRICALIGVDGQPASELRGLHAWLAVLLPECAERLIDADPFGVLSYGDVAALSIANRQTLLEALGRLANRDPWFRGKNWSLANLGALSGPDMVPGFRWILASKEAGFTLRSIVLDALRAGTPILELQPDLLDILVDASAPYAERSDALHGLLKMGEATKRSIVEVCARKLDLNADGIRLSAEILVSLYDEFFGPSDVIKLLVATMRCAKELIGGMRYDKL